MLCRPGGSTRQDPPYGVVAFAVVLLIDLRAARVTAVVATIVAMRPTTSNA